MRKRNSKSQNAAHADKWELPNNCGSFELIRIVSTDMCAIKTTINPNAAQELARNVERLLRRRGIRSKIPEAAIEKYQQELNAMAGYTVYIARPKKPESA